ncbi:MAG: response regulator [Polyangiaceae bacterium]|nr:response regulator [Polyangiaceae bacterium]
MTSVLVVDDSAIDRRLAGALLAKRGFDVEYATDGQDALARIEQARPDAVVTDLQMPKMTGLELVEAVRQRFPSLPVILMTAHGSEQIAMLALKTGAASFVPKRRLADDLGDTIEAVVAISHDVGRISTVDPLDVREMRFQLGTDLQALGDVVGQLEAHLLQMGPADETLVVQVAVALREAIVNAIVHGNLEVSSSLLEDGGAAFAQAIEERRQKAPYRDRKVSVVARYAPGEVRYVITDQGPGFDPSTLPDPTDLTNLEKASGRGLMLIRTFMEEVSFNERGNEIRMTKRLVQ